MSRIAIVIDRWKLPIFTKHLEPVGAFETISEEGRSLVTLIIESEREIIQPIVIAAQLECARNSSRRLN